MSMITENTIVMRTQDIDKLKHAVEQHKAEYDYRIEEPKEVFRNNEIAIFVFDCNGQPLGLEENLDWLVLETNFLDGEEYYTQWFNPERGCYEETDDTAEELIEKMLDKETFAAIKNSIRYSVEAEWDEDDECDGWYKYEINVKKLCTYTVYASSDNEAIVQAIDYFCDDDAFYGSEETENVNEEDCEIMFKEEA